MPSPLFYLPVGSSVYMPLPAYSGCLGWFFLLSNIVIGPTAPNTSYSFQFIVTALIEFSSGVVSYSLDPEMDVTP